jgi:pseudouridine kinase
VQEDEPYVVVVGGATIDLKAQASTITSLGTSNPGHARLSPGGVGRNVAENLARLGTRVHLIAAVGRDAWGDRLLAETSAAGVDTRRVVRTDHPTGTYTAVLDRGGDLGVGVADMTATDALGPEAVVAVRELVAAAALVVLDANLAAATLATAMDIAVQARVPLLIDPVSRQKAKRLAPLLTAPQPVFAITPNRDELAALTGLEAPSRWQPPPTRCTAAAYGMSGSGSGRMVRDSRPPTPRQCRSRPGAAK